MISMIAKVADMIAKMERRSQAMILLLEARKAFKSPEDELNALCCLDKAPDIFASSLRDCLDNEPVMFLQRVSDHHREAYVVDDYGMSWIFEPFHGDRSVATPWKMHNVTYVSFSQMQRVCEARCLTVKDLLQYFYEAIRQDIKAQLNIRLLDTG